MHKDIEKRRQYIKEYEQKRSADPVRHAAHKAMRVANYNKISVDPVRCEARTARRANSYYKLMADIDYHESKKTRERKWTKNNPFLSSLKNSRRTAKKKKILPCNASLEEITKAWTGKCHNPACSNTNETLCCRLCLDHDHITGRFRGWLCRACNVSLGFLNEDKQKIIGLAAYLELPNAKS